MITRTPRLKVLNLYAGLGGNRKLWENVQVTAIEYAKKIADIYSSNFPNDEVIITDAHQFLLEHYSEYDFIWSSPPCQSHTKMIRSGKNRKSRFPDMKLYEEIIFLMYNFNGKYVVENVMPYYKPPFNPTQIGRHLFWSNFKITHFNESNFPEFITADSPQNIIDMKKWLGIEYEGNIYYEGNHSPGQVLRNCVHPNLGLHILNCALNKETAIQTTLLL